MKVVLDTDVIVAGMRSPGGASAAILRKARQGRITLLVSVPLVLEYEAICSEAEHRLAAGLSEREVAETPHGLVAVGHSNNRRWSYYLRCNACGDCSGLFVA